MTLPAGINKWGVVVLGVVCLLLGANLVRQYRALQPAKSAPHPNALSASHPRTGRDSSHAADDLAQYDPSIHFDALKKLDSRPPPDEDRNPFASLGGPGPEVAKGGPAPPPTPPPPPAPPPPPPLKAVGYNELPGGKKEAMVTFNDDMVVVHEGDLIGTKYKVVKIDSSMVVVEDGDTQKTLELPFPQ
ncbi:MAG: hypothetical protein WAO35_22455 [Terriglobia bacterium]